MDVAVADFSPQIRGLRALTFYAINDSAIIVFGYHNRVTLRVYSNTASITLDGSGHPRSGRRRA